MESKRFCSIRETARFTGLGEAFLRRGVKDGTVPFVQTGRKVLVNVPLLLERLEEQCGKGKAS